MVVFVIGLGVVLFFFLIYIYFLCFSSILKSIFEVVLKVFLKRWIKEEL